MTVPPNVQRKLSAAPQRFHAGIKLHQPSMLSLHCAIGVSRSTEKKKEHKKKKTGSLTQKIVEISFVFANAFSLYTSTVHKGRSVRAVAVAPVPLPKQ